jgi:hypothetical protein
LNFGVAVVLAAAAAAAVTALQADQEHTLKKLFLLQPVAATKCLLEQQLIAQTANAVAEGVIHGLLAPD